MRIISDKKYNAEIEAVRAQTAEEVKGFYATAPSDTALPYIKLIASQTRGMLEMFTQGEISRRECKRLYEQNGSVHGIVDLVARNVGEVAQYLELQAKDGTPVERHWVNDLLARPNDRYTLRKYFFGYAVQKCIYGDCFNYAPKAVGSKRGTIREMYLLSGDKVGIQHGDWDALFKDIIINGQSIAATDVFENFDYNLDDTQFFGTSKLAAAALYLTILERTMSREATALQNGGVANIITPANSNLPVLPDQAKSAEQELNAAGNINKTKFVRMPIDVHELGNKPIDLDILSSHKEAVTALCFVFGIPVDLYYGQSKYENAKEAKKTIYEQVAIPMVTEWGEDFLSYAGLARDFRLVVNTDKIDVLQDNPYEAALKMSQIGAFTTNEIRETAGWEAIAEPWADEVRIPMGVQIGNEVADINELDL